MTIDEAIECEINHRLYPEYHEQIAEWLEELKTYKSLAPRELVSEKQKNDRDIEYNKGFDYGFKTGYNKAIDDLMEKVSECFISDADWNYLLQESERLKAGDAK